MDLIRREIQLGARVEDNWGSEGRQSQEGDCESQGPSFTSQNTALFFATGEGALDLDKEVASIATMHF